MSRAFLVTLILQLNFAASISIEPLNVTDLEFRSYMNACTQKHPTISPLPCIIEKIHDNTPNGGNPELRVASWIYSIPLMEANRLVLHGELDEVPIDDQYKRFGATQTVLFGSLYFRVDYESHYDAIRKYLLKDIIFMEEGFRHFGNWLYVLPRIRVRAKTPCTTPIDEWLSSLIFPMGKDKLPKDGPISALYLYFYICRPLFRLHAKYRFLNNKSPAKRGLIIKLQRLGKILPLKLKLLYSLKYRKFLKALFSIGKVFEGKTGSIRNVTVPFIPILDKYMTVNGQWPQLPIESVEVANNEFHAFIHDAKRKQLDVAISEYARAIYSERKPLGDIKLDAFYVFEGSPFTSVYSFYNTLAPTHRKKLKLMPWNYLFFTLCESLNADFESVRTLRMVTSCVFVGIGFFLYFARYLIHL